MEVTVRELDVLDSDGVLFVVGDAAEASLWKNGEWQEQHPIMITRILAEEPDEDKVIVEHRRVKPCRAVGGDEALPEQVEAIIVSDTPGEGWRLRPMRADDYDQALLDRQAWHRKTLES